MHSTLGARGDVWRAQSQSQQAYAFQFGITTQSSHHAGVARPGRAARNRRMQGGRAVDICRSPAHGSTSDPELEAALDLALSAGNTDRSEQKHGSDYDRGAAPVHPFEAYNDMLNMQRWTSSLRTPKSVQLVLPDAPRNVQQEDGQPGKENRRRRRRRRRSRKQWRRTQKKSSAEGTRHSNTASGAPCDNDSDIGASNTQHWNEPGYLPWNTDDYRKNGSLRRSHAANKKVAEATAAIDAGSWKPPRWMR